MNRKLCLFVVLASLDLAHPALAEEPAASGRSTTIAAAETAAPAAKKKSAGKSGKKRGKKLRRKPGPAPGAAVAPNPNAPLSIEDAIADQIGAAAAKSARENRGTRRTGAPGSDDSLRDATMGTNRLSMPQNNPLPVEPPAANNNNMNN